MKTKLATVSPTKKRSNSITLDLVELLLSSPGETFTAHDLAEHCECRTRTIDSQVSNVNLELLRRKTGYRVARFNSDATWQLVTRN